MTSSPVRPPGAAARDTRRPSSVTRPATRGAVTPSTTLSAASSRSLSELTRDARALMMTMDAFASLSETPRGLLRFPAQRTFDRVELRREARVDDAELRLDD